MRVAPVPAGTVTISLDRVEISRALRELFGPEASFVFLYRATPDAAGGAALDEVRVTFPGAGTALGRSPMATRAPGRDSRSPGRSSGQEDARPRPDGEDAPPRLDHRDPLVRLEALNAIVDRADGSGVEEVRQVLLGDEDDDVRTRAAAVLGRIGTPEALEALRDALRDAETAVRLTAIDAITHFETPRALALLQDALRDRDDEVRSVAAAALRQLRRGRL